MNKTQIKLWRNIAQFIGVLIYIGSFFSTFSSVTYASGTATLEAVASTSTVSPNSTGTVSVYLTASTPGTDGGDFTVQASNATINSLTWTSAATALPGNSTPSNARNTPFLANTTISTKTKLYDFTYTAAASGNVTISFTGVQMVAKADSTDMTVTTKNASITIVAPTPPPTPSAPPTGGNSTPNSSTPPSTITPQTPAAPKTTPSIQPNDKVTKPAENPSQPPNVVTGEAYNKDIDAILTQEAAEQNPGNNVTATTSKKSSKRPTTYLVIGSIGAIVVAGIIILLLKRRNLHAAKTHPNVQLPPKYSQSTSHTQSVAYSPTPISHSTQPTHVVHPTTSQPTQIPTTPQSTYDPSPLTPEHKLVPGTTITPGSIVEPKQ